jgi:hypothetical protein
MSSVDVAISRARRIERDPLGIGSTDASIWCQRLGRNNAHGSAARQVDGGTLALIR